MDLYRINRRKPFIHVAYINQSDSCRTRFVTKVHAERRLEDDNLCNRFHDNHSVPVADLLAGIQRSVKGKRRAKGRFARVRDARECALHEWKTALCESGMCESVHFVKKSENFKIKRAFACRKGFSFVIYCRREI